MSEHEAAAEARVPARVALVVLIGLPASGKSTLARSLLAHPWPDEEAAVAVAVRHVEVDALIADPNRAASPGGAEGRAAQPQTEGTPTEPSGAELPVDNAAPQDPTTPGRDGPLGGLGGEDAARAQTAAVGESWRDQRRAVLDRIEALVAHAQTPEVRETTATVIVVDDNMYLRSMRYSLYQLARHCQTAFLQVHVECPVEACLQRNTTRPHPIREQVIADMAGRLEPPGSLSWEQAHSCTIHTAVTPIEAATLTVAEAILDALDTPAPPYRLEDYLAKELSRAAVLESVVHQLDLSTRKVMSQLLSATPRGSTSAPTKGQRQRAAQALTTLRKAHLQTARGRSFSGTSRADEVELMTYEFQRAAERQLVADLGPPAVTPGEPGPG